MGLLLRLASPVILIGNWQVERSPKKKRAVVPELPQ